MMRNWIRIQGENYRVLSLDDDIPSIELKYHLDDVDNADFSMVGEWHWAGGFIESLTYIRHLVLARVVGFHTPIIVCVKKCRYFITEKCDNDPKTLQVKDITDRVRQVADLI